jgi:hypothetical protein
LPLLRHRSKQTNTGNLGLLPSLAKIPYPPWALKKEDVDTAVTNGEAADGAPAAVTAKKSRREADFA